MTTQQTYALFAIVVCLIILIGITYCAGLKTGSRAAEQKATTKAEEHAANYAVMHADLRNSYATSIEQHQAQLDEVIQDADKRIATYARRANPFTEEDRITLQALANQLDTAGNTYAGLGAIDQVRFARQMQQRALNLAERLHITLKQAAADGPLPEHQDTQLIEWLNNNAAYCDSAVGFILEVDMADAPEFPDHLRELLVAVIQQQKQDTITAGNVIGEFMEARMERAA